MSTNPCADALYCTAGDAWTHAFQYCELTGYDEITGEPIAGDPIDLTGISARLDVRDEQGDTLLTGSTTGGELSIEAATGTITVSATASDTAPFATARPRELAVALRIWETGAYDATAQTIANYTLIAKPTTVGGEV